MPTDAPARLRGASRAMPHGGAGRLLLAALGVALFALAAPAARAEGDAGAPRPAADREAAALKVEGSLMCHCGCTDLTVRVCNCGVAAGIKDDIRARLAAGQSPEAGVAAHGAQYGRRARSAQEAAGPR